MTKIEAQYNWEFLYSTGRYISAFINLLYSFEVLLVQFRMVRIWTNLFKNVFICKKYRDAYQCVNLSSDFDSFEYC